MQYSQYDSNFGHYFRNLYRIIKFIDEYDFKFKDAVEDYNFKYKYTSIVRSQLSDYELYWIFYNGLCEYGSDKFKPLIEKYTILKVLIGFWIGETDQIIFPELKEMPEFYKNSAFFRPQEDEIEEHLKQFNYDKLLTH